MVNAAALQPFHTSSCPAFAFIPSHVPLAVQHAHKPPSSGLPSLGLSGDSLLTDTHPWAAWTVLGMSGCTNPVQGKNSPVAALQVATCRSKATGLHHLVHNRRKQEQDKGANSSTWQKIATKKPLTHGEGKEVKPMKQQKKERVKH